MRAYLRPFIIVLAIVLVVAVGMKVMFRGATPKSLQQVTGVKYNLLYAFIPLDDSAVCQDQIFSKIYHREPNADIKNPRAMNCNVPLFIYDVQQKSSQPIAIDVAQKLKYQYLLDDLMVSQYCTAHYDKYEHTVSPAFKPVKQPAQMKYPCVVHGNEFINLNIPYSESAAREFVFLGWLVQ